MASDPFHGLGGGTTGHLAPRKNAKGRKVQVGERNGDSLQRIFLTASKSYIKDFFPPQIDLDDAKKLHLLRSSLSQVSGYS